VSSSVVTSPLVTYSTISEVIALCKITTIFRSTLIFGVESKVLLRNVILALDFVRAEPRIGNAEEASVMHGVTELLCQLLLAPWLIEDGHINGLDVSPWQIIYRLLRTVPFVRCRRLRAVFFEKHGRHDNKPMKNDRITDSNRTEPCCEMDENTRV
jgi:hypothetical protein